MVWVTAIMAGAVIGLLASLLSRTARRDAHAMNIGVAVVGSGLGKTLFGNLMGTSAGFSNGGIEFLSALWGMLGAVIVIVLMQSYRLYKYS